MPVVEEIVERTYRWEMPAVENDDDEDSIDGITFSAKVDSDHDIYVDINDGDNSFYLKPEHIDGLIAVLRRAKAAL